MDDSIVIDPETGKVQIEHWYGNTDTGVVIDSVTETVDVLAGGQIRSYFRNINTSSLACGQTLNVSSNCGGGNTA